MVAFPVACEPSTFLVVVRENMLTQDVDSLSEPELLGQMSYVTVCSISVDVDSTNAASSDSSFSPLPTQHRAPSRVRSISSPTIGMFKTNFVANWSIPFKARDGRSSILTLTPWLVCHTLTPLSRRYCGCSYPHQICVCVQLMYTHDSFPPFYLIMRKCVLKVSCSRFR